MNSLPRWLISITDMPEPWRSSISSAAWRSTASGRAAGPGLKLNTRVIVEFSASRQRPHRPRGRKNTQPCRRARILPCFNCHRDGVLQRRARAFRATVRRFVDARDRAARQRMGRGRHVSARAVRARPPRSARSASAIPRSSAARRRTLLQHRSRPRRSRAPAAAACRRAWSRTRSALPPIVAHGSAALKRRVVPPVLRGREDRGARASPSRAAAPTSRA